MAELLFYILGFVFAVWLAVVTNLDLKIRTRRAINKDLGLGE